MLSAFRILLVNEFVSLLRAPTAMFFIFLFPVFFMAIMLFSYGSQGVLGPVTVEIVDHDHSPLSTDYVSRIRKLFSSGDVIVGDIVTADTATPVGAGHVRITIPAGFGTAVGNGHDTTVHLDYDVTGSMVTQVAARIFDPLTTRFNVEVAQLETPVKLEYKNVSGVPPVEFPQYLVTGIVVMSMMSGSLFSTGLTIAVRREQNTFKLMSCFPLGPGSLLLAILAARVVMIIFAAILLLFVSVDVFGLKLDLELSRLINSFGLIVVGGLALLSLGLMLAARVSTVEGANFSGNLVYVALLFLSDIAVPLRNLPSGPDRVLSLLPTAQFVHALRSVLVQGASFAHEWRAVVIMLIWTALFLVVARVTFRWHAA